MLTVEKLARFSAKVGIAIPSAEVYGGFAGFYDWGPVGVELRRNVENLWWKYFVHEKDFVRGIDGAIVTHPSVWKASGHVDHFTDPIVTCKQCGRKYRADHLAGIDSSDPQAIEQAIREKDIRCPACGGELGAVKLFNLMFSTQVGPYEGEISYLRPETAQLIFINFPRVYLWARKRIPLGIAQTGRAFRNEISPRNFVFRLREFEQMEIEFFFDPENDSCPYYEDVKDFQAKVLTAEMQERGEKEREEKVSEVVGDYPGREWMIYWIVESLRWFESIGVPLERLRIRQQLPDERAHYSMDTWDIEFYFDDLGWKEIEGIAHRSDYDLSRHQQFSGEDFTATREDGSKFVPWVIEPSWGLERTILAVLYSAYREDEKRTYLALDPKVAPYKVAVFPLVSKDGLPEKAKEVYNMLRRYFRVFYDEKGSIGKRYRRMDEIGTPFCITIDYQTLEDGTVTIRERDSMEQVRIPISGVIEWISEHLRK